MAAERPRAARLVARHDSEGAHTKSTHVAVSPRAQPEWFESESLLALTEEKVIRRVVYELSLTSRASRRGNSPASGI